MVAGVLNLLIFLIITLSFTYLTFYRDPAVTLRFPFPTCISHIPTIMALQAQGVSLLSDAAEAYFRFLDLPPEVRNDIYEHITDLCRVEIIGNPVNGRRFAKPQPRYRRYAFGLRFFCGNPMCYEDEEYNNHNSACPLFYHKPLDPTGFMALFTIPWHLSQTCRLLRSDLGSFWSATP